MTSRFLGNFIRIVTVLCAIRCCNAAANADAVAHGHYLSDIGGCTSCHSVPGGAPYAGGLYMETPFGSISTPNITPDKATGIGSYSDEDFYRVMHEGIAPHHEYLYPVMPFPFYTKLTRDDVMKIRAYLNTLTPVHAERLPNKLRFPFSVRQALVGWRAVFFKPGKFTPDPHASEQVNRGAYLVESLAHCGECHNGFNLAGESKFDKAFQGGVIDNWYAPNITADVRDGIGGWSNQQLATYLKTGIAPDKGIAAGPMALTVSDLHHVSDSDLDAIAAYLKTTKPHGDPHQRLALFEGRDARGGDVYLNRCASCHGVDGKGLRGAVPALQGNGLVDARGPEDVIGVVLGGLRAHGSYAPMPAVGATMTDEEIAAVANFVRQIGSNSAPATAAPGDVAKLRSDTSTLMNGGAGTHCPDINDKAFAAAAARVQLDQQLAGANADDALATAQQVARALRNAAPHLANAELVNGVAASYCQTLAHSSLDTAAKSEALGEFAELVYAELNGGVAQKLALEPLSQR